MSKKYKAANRLRRERTEHLFDMLNVFDAEFENIKSQDVIDSHAKARAFALEMFARDIMDVLARRG